MEGAPEVLQRGKGETELGSWQRSPPLHCPEYEMRKWAGCREHTTDAGCAAMQDQSPGSKSESLAREGARNSSKSQSSLTARDVFLLLANE